MVALVDNVPRTLHLQRGDPQLRRAPARGDRPPHQARALRKGGARAHPAGPADRARPPRRDHRTDPRLARPRRRARAAGRALRAEPHPGDGDPRPAPVAADRAGGRLDQTGARRRDRADRRAARDPRRRVARARGDQGGAVGDLRALRRRAAHGDQPLRGRDRHRGPDRRPADGDHDHADRLHQVAAAGDLPPAAARRARRDRHGHEGRRLHRAPVRLLVARLPAVLLQPRQGLPLEGLRAARGLAHGEGPRARQHPAAARRRAHPGGRLHARLLRDQVPRLRDASRGRSRRPSSSPTTRRSKPTASSRSRSATTTSCSPCARSTPTTRSSWSRRPA